MCSSVALLVKAVIEADQLKLPIFWWEEPAKNQIANVTLHPHAPA